jgi:uncharacterized membrane protein
MLAFFVLRETYSIAKICGLIVIVAGIVIVAVS